MEINWGAVSVICGFLLHAAILSHQLGKLQQLVHDMNDRLKRLEDLWDRKED